MKLKKIYFTVIFSIIIVSVPEFCFAEFLDGDRDGFVFSVGFGGSGVVYRQYVRKGSPETVTTADSWSVEPAFDISCDMGYGFTKQLQIVLFSKSSYMFRIRNINGKKVNLDSSLFGIGVYYFLDPEVSSFYINGGLGLSGLDATNSNKSDMVGLGARIGVGYEFIQNAAVDFSVMYTTNYIEEAYADANVNSIVMSLAFKTMFY